MVLKEQHNYDPSIIIPATFEDGKLELRNNGVSEVFFSSSLEEFGYYDAKEFQLYAICNTPMERPFFVSWYYAKHNADRKITDSIISESVDHEGDPDIDGIILWELFYVYSKRKVEPDGTVKKKALQYTCLRQCPPGTLFCKCDDCSSHFIITPQTSKFYIDRGLEIPTKRCSKCIQKKRMKYGGKN